MKEFFKRLDAKHWVRFAVTVMGMIGSSYLLGFRYFVGVALFMWVLMEINKLVDEVM